MKYDHDFQKQSGMGKRCRHCLKAYWRAEEPCEMDDDDIRRRPVFAEGEGAEVIPFEEEQRVLDPRDPKVKQERIAAHLERTGLADVVMSGARAKALLQSLSLEYDEDPARFIPYGAQ